MTKYTLLEQLKPKPAHLVLLKLAVAVYNESSDVCARVLQSL